MKKLIAFILVTGLLSSFGDYSAYAANNETVKDYTFESETLGSYTITGILTTADIEHMIYDEDTEKYYVTGTDQYNREWKIEVFTGTIGRADNRMEGILWDYFSTQQLVVIFNNSEQGREIAFVYTEDK